MSNIFAISRSEFHRFVRTQMSGRVNMQDDETVALIAAIPREKVGQIRDLYELLLEEFGEPDAGSS